MARTWCRLTRRARSGVPSAATAPSRSHKPGAILALLRSRESIESSERVDSSFGTYEKYRQSGNVCNGIASSADRASGQEDDRQNEG
jgi:hypothetical protein